MQHLLTLTVIMAHFLAVTLHPPQPPPKKPQKTKPAKDEDEQHQLEFFQVNKPVLQAK